MKLQAVKTERRKMYGYRVAALLVSLLAIACLVCPRLVSCPAGAKFELVHGSPQEGRSYLEVDVTLPYLRRGKPVNQFQALRELVVAGAGFDFLAKCGDMLRLKDAVSSKPGVVYRSRHKCGDAFDYNQEDPRVLLVRERVAERTYWRTYLVCEKQDGSLGVKAKLATDNLGNVSAYVFDFTAAAESLGWARIPAGEGWEWEPTKKEYWHYEMPEGLSFERAIALVDSGLVERAGSPLSIP